MALLVVLVLAACGLAQSVPNISRSCNSITIESQLVLNSQPVQQASWFWGNSKTQTSQIKIPVATEGRVIHPYSPSASSQASLLLGSDVSKTLFSIS